MRAGGTYEERKVLELAHRRLEDGDAAGPVVRVDLPDVIGGGGVRHVGVDHIVAEVAKLGLGGVGLGRIVGVRRREGRGLFGALYLDGLRIVGVGAVGRRGGRIEADAGLARRWLASGRRRDRIGRHLYDGGRWSTGRRCM